MLIPVDKVKSIDDFKDYDTQMLERKLKAIEVAIRSYTHNKFQNRNIRFVATSLDGVINGTTKYLKVGDTLEISKSMNAGLYVITDITETDIVLDKDLYEELDNLVTKIEYPEDVIEGALDILRWDLGMKDKIGIASESLSRHSVTYQSLDSSNTIEGRPSVLFGFCTPYMKARF